MDGSVFLLPKAPAIVAADIKTPRVGERVLAGEYLPATRADDLLLYDRSYAAFWLFAAHAVELRHFCARLPRTSCADVTAFAAGRARSSVITLTSGEEARRQCHAFGLPSEALRLIRMHLKG